MVGRRMLHFSLVGVEQGNGTTFGCKTIKPHGWKITTSELSRRKPLQNVDHFSRSRKLSGTIVLKRIIWKQFHGAKIHN
jgi:hypothetical protein